MSAASIRLTANDVINTRHPRPVPIGIHLDCVGGITEGAYQFAHLFQREGGTQRVGEEFLLVRRGVAGVRRDEVLDLRFTFGETQIAVEQPRVPRGDTNRCGNHHHLA
jgi:hypothetical protein